MTHQVTVLLFFSLACGVVSVLTAAVLWLMDWSARREMRRYVDAEIDAMSGGRRQ